MHRVASYFVRDCMPTGLTRLFNESLEEHICLQGSGSLPQRSNNFYISCDAPWITDTADLNSLLGIGGCMWKSNHCLDNFHIRGGPQGSGSVYIHVHTFIAYLIAVYFDDIVIAGPADQLQLFKTKLSSIFDSSYFIAISVSKSNETCTGSGIFFISYQLYVL
jgi:hypothetical protein